MTNLCESQRVVLAVAGRELGGIGEEQQRLADDLAEAFGGALPDAVVRRLQAFDLLRQRVDGVARALGALETTPPEGLAEAVPAVLTLETQRRAFAQALGVEAGGEDGEEIELF